MKKILFLIPLLGICSSLLAQAPTVTNVQAEQVQGTKDVAISFELTGKDSGGGTGSPVYGEFWFKETESKTTWTKVSTVGSIDEFSGTLNSANMIESDPETGTETFYPTLWLGDAGLSPAAKSFIWNAGDDAPNINTSDAKIRIIAFYPKMLEDGVTLKPMSEQTSGWNGEGDFGASGSNPDSNGTAGTDTNGTNEGPDVYYLNPQQVGDATSYSTEAAGYYAFEAFYDEPAEHNGYVGTEVKQLIAVWDDAGIWRHDQGIGPWQLSSALFPTLDSVGVWISNNQLTSQGKVTYNDPNPGDGI